MIPYERAKRRMVMGHEEELHDVSLNPLDEIKLPVQELVPRTKGH
jgi:hypothetical protein